MTLDTEILPAVATVNAAAMSAHVSSSSRDNIVQWLRDPQFAAERPVLLEHIRAAKWDVLEDVFWTTIPFGTAGRRGRMYPIGTNAINTRTMGETFQALAQYVLQWREEHTVDVTQPASCAIGYDTRHRSDEFAELCGEIMVAHGFHVFFLREPQATPLLSLTVRAQGCDCGVMVTASHNPPSDNAAKVFWRGGVQVRAPHDAAITERLASIGELKRVPFASAVHDGRVQFCQQEMLAAYRRAIQNIVGATTESHRSLRILFSPLHGVGSGSVLPVLADAGFAQVRLHQRHAAPDGDFPNVPEHVANPECPAVFDELIEAARAADDDLVIASDPDADRIGCAAPRQLHGHEWATLTGNQIGVLIADDWLQRLQAAGKLTPSSYLIKTLVTTDMYFAIGAAFGIRVIGDCLTGFKWIGGRVDELGPDDFVLGTEEAHGYLVGTHVRDKDAGVAAVLLAVAAEAAKRDGQSLLERLDDCYRRYGCYQESAYARTCAGADGQLQMGQIMSRLRNDPPRSLAEHALGYRKDYGSLVQVDADGNESRLDGPASNLLILGFSGGLRVAVRPSGTEPRIKFYFFARQENFAPDQLDAVKRSLQSTLQAAQTELLRTLDGVC